MQGIASKSPENKPVRGQFSLADSAAYAQWRERKLAQAPQSAQAISIAIADLACPSQVEKAAIIDACSKANMAIYRIARPASEAAIRSALKCFAAALGLSGMEDHRSAAGDGIVAITPSDKEEKERYIPYSNRPLSWHTDGYYNYHGPDNCIRGMLLHCVRNASSGGENAFLDPEIAYIRLRDLNPDYIAALMHPQAMTIPPGEGAGGKPRPANSGPVFAVDPADGSLIMRFTERKRHIIWRDDAATIEAVQTLYRILQDEPCILRKRLEPGEGIVCNNVLHARTAFDPNRNEDANRLLYRVRYKNVVGAQSSKARSA
ncbi:MAG: TauD/TfdA family dioxygenase [Beijerinckiaceae bacterium]